MKRFILAGVVALFSGNLQLLFAQEKHVQLETFNCFSATRLINDGSVPNEVAKSFNSLSQWKPSFSMIGKYVIPVFKKSGIFIGLGYQNFGERTKKIPLGNFGGSSATMDAIRFRYVNHYAVIPLGYKRYFTHRFYVITSVDLLVNISNRLVEKRFYSDSRSDVERMNDDSFEPRKLLCQVGLGSGWDLIQKEQFKIFLEPMIHGTLSTIAKDEPLNRKMVCFGFTTGIRF